MLCVEFGKVFGIKTMDQAEFQDWLSASDRLTALDSTQAAEIADALRLAVAKDAVLAGDAARCYPPCARSLGLSHIALNQSAGRQFGVPATSRRSATGKAASRGSCSTSEASRRNTSETTFSGTGSPASTKTQVRQPASEPLSIRNAYESLNEPKEYKPRRRPCVACSETGS